MKTKELPSDWRSIFHDAIAPRLSTAGLIALRQALEEDDPRLLQCSTVEPAPIDDDDQRPVEGACPLGWCLWQGEGLVSAGAVWVLFNALLNAVDAAWPLPGDVCGTSRRFIHWIDNTEREMMRRELLLEVVKVLTSRMAEVAK